MGDPIVDRCAAVFEFDDTDGDPVDVEDQIGSSLVAPFEGDFFGDGKVVFGGVGPVEQVDCFGNSTGFDFDWHAVTEQFVDRFVVVVEATAVVVRFLA